MASFFNARGVEESLWKRAVVALIVPALVFIFFVRLMCEIKKTFGGDYSRFVHFDHVRLASFDQLYWDVDPPLLFDNSDFEKGILENWTPEGEAFLYQPVGEENLKANNRPFFLNGQGRYWIGTYDKSAGVSQGDGPEGRLASIPFTIKKDKIGFLLGGGRTDLTRALGRQAAVLEVGGRVVREDTGRNLERMGLRVWDVRRWLGKEARILLIDDPSERAFFRHLNADWFHYYRESPVRRTLSSGPTGYDGEFYFFLACDPFLERYRDEARRALLVFDQPAYRCGRIGFPLLVRLVSAGNPARFPAAMVWLVVVSHILGAFFFLKIILFFRRSPWWALLYVLVPGFHLSLYFGLPESLCLAFLLAGLYFYLRRRLAAAALLAAAAVLVREMALPVVLIAAAYEIFKRRDFKNALWLGASVLPYGLWRVFLTLRLFDIYGWRTLFFRSNVLDVPFSGIGSLFQHIHAGRYPPDLVPTAVGYPLLLGFLFLLAAILVFRRQNIFSLSLVFYVLVAVSLNYIKMWIHTDNAVRSTPEAFLFLVLAYVSQERPSRPWLAYALLGFYAAVLLFDVFILRTGTFIRSML